MKRRERAPRSDSEDGAITAGPARRGCPVEVPVGSLNQPGDGNRAVGTVEHVQDLDLLGPRGKLEDRAVVRGPGIRRSRRMPASRPVSVRPKPFGSRPWRAGPKFRKQRFQIIANTSAHRAPRSTARPLRGDHPKAEFGSDELRPDCRASTLATPKIPDFRDA